MGTVYDFEAKNKKHLTVANVLHLYESLSLERPEYKFEGIELDVLERSIRSKYRWLEDKEITEGIEGLVEVGFGYIYNDRLHLKYLK